MMPSMRRRIEMGKIFLGVSKAVSSSLDLTVVAALVLKASMKALGADHAALFLADADSGRLTLNAVRGFSRDELDNIKLLASWEAVNEHLVDRGEAVIMNDIRTNPVFRKKRLPFLRERLPISSFLAAPLTKDGTLVGALIVSNRKRRGHRFTPEDRQLLATLSNQVATALLNAALYQRLKELFISTVKALARAIEAKDRYTSGHSERVMRYALAIGKELRLKEESMENLRLASLLHDVGKIGVKESVLLKPGGLVGYEKSQIHRHPAIGAAIVRNVKDAEKIIPGILEHHERYDGKGYPAGMKGRAISLAGRVIAVADAFDALTTDRPYQKGYAPKEAFFEIRKSASHQFDPKVVKAFVVSFSKYPETWMGSKRG